MSDRYISDGSEAIGLIGLIVLFCNFGTNQFDLYDAIIHYLMK